MQQIGGFNTKCIIINTHTDDCSSFMIRIIKSHAEHEFVRPFDQSEQTHAQVRLSRRMYAVERFYPS